MKKRDIFLKIEECSESKIERLMAVCFNIDELLMIPVENGLDFPILELDSKKPVALQIQRAMYSKYGALIKAAHSLGALYFDKKPLPVFVCIIAGIEPTTPFGYLEQFRMVEIGHVCESLAAQFWQSMKNVFLYHAYRVYRSMEKETREDLIRKEHYPGY